MRRSHSPLPATPLSASARKQQLKYRFIPLAISLAILLWAWVALTQHAHGPYFLPHKVKLENAGKNNNATGYVFAHPKRGLGNRLRAIASAIYVSKTLGLPLKIIWLDNDEEVADMGGAWSDYFLEPKLDIVNKIPSSCCTEQEDCGPLPRMLGWQDLTERVGSWVMEGYKTDLCFMAWDEFSKGTPHYDKFEFYSQLRLAPSLQATIDSFKKEQGWDSYGQWIGVHVRRTDLQVHGNGTRVNITDIMSDMSAYIKLATLLAERAPEPRWFLATDDASAEVDFKKAMKDAKVKNYDKITTFPKPARDASTFNGGVAEFRANVQGMKEGVVDLFLLGETAVVIGTESSSYSWSAERLSNRPFVFRIGPTFTHMEYSERLAVARKIKEAIKTHTSDPNAIIKVLV